MRVRREKYEAVKRTRRLTKFTDEPGLCIKVKHYYEEIMFGYFYIFGDWCWRSISLASNFFSVALGKRAAVCTHCMIVCLGFK